MASLKVDLLNLLANLPYMDEPAGRKAFLSFAGYLLDFAVSLQNPSFVGKRQCSGPGRKMKSQLTCQGVPACL